VGSPARPSSLNWREIDLVLRELDLPGLYVRDITQPDRHSFILEVAGRGRAERVLVVLAPPFVRMHATSRRAAAAEGGGPRAPGKSPLRFAALLRAHVRGGKITEASQLGGERVIRLAVRRADADTVLFLRLWSNAANAILTGADGGIVDVFYRRPKKGELAGRPFVPPEPRGPGREYAVRDLPGEGTFNERLDRVADESARSAATEASTTASLRALLASEERLETRVRTLERQEAENAGFERLKDYADLLLANLGAAARGDHWLDLPDARIELDPRLGPSENAQAYFARWKKGRTAAARLEGELRTAREELGRLRAALAAVSPPEGAPPDPELLGRTLRELGVEAEPPHAAPARAPKEPPPGLRFRSGAFTVLVGRSGTENDDLLRRHVRGNDTWFHCRDYPGAYVFVRSLPGKSVPLEVMLDAANLAIHYSKAKASGAADVYYTAVKYLRRPRDGPVGLVLPTMERNLHVRHEPERIERLKATQDPPRA
jgi:predicted ribosome quality control (RQC) complex YloA/Tae2 family protein